MCESKLNSIMIIIITKYLSMAVKRPQKNLLEGVVKSREKLSIR